MTRYRFNLVRSLLPKTCIYLNLLFALFGIIFTIITYSQLMGKGGEQRRHSRFVVKCSATLTVYREVFT